MSAKNIAQKLTGDLEVSASRDKLLVRIGLAELPGRAVEGLGDLLGGNHSFPLRELIAANANLNCPWRDAYSLNPPRSPNLE